MSRKTKRNLKPTPTQVPESPRRRRIAVGALLFLAVAATLGYVFRPTPEPPAAVSHPEHGDNHEETPPYFESAEAARPLPVTLPPESFSKPYVVRAYQIVREIPEVLAQQPCYCYCNHFGHRSLLDCYRDDHGAG